MINTMPAEIGGERTTRHNLSKFMIKLVYKT